MGLWKSHDNGLNWKKININIDKTEYITSISCNGSGDKLIASTNKNLDIYTSIDYGTTWKSIYSSVFVKGVTSSSNSLKLYAIVNDNIYTNINGWGSTCVNGDIKLKWDSICCNDKGDKVYAILKGVGIYLFYKENYFFIRDDTVKNISCITNSQKFLISTGSHINICQIVPPLTCIKENTKLLSFGEEYIPIEFLKKGDILKTKSHGYKKIENVIYRNFYNEISTERIKQCLYVYPSEKNCNNLIVTGCTKVISEKGESIESYLDTNSLVYPYNDNFAIYYISLENENLYNTYTIWANGKLIETSPIYYLETAINFKYDPKSPIKPFITC